MTTPSAVVKDPLEAAAERWGLDAAPPSGTKRSAVKPEVQRRANRLRRTFGTPLDVVRGMMAKQPYGEWESALRAISPKSDTHSYLLFAWKEPLDEALGAAPKEKGRWCLYEAIPNALIATDRRMELESPPFWTLPQAERHGQAVTVSAYQWAMYHAHKVDVRPFWCLQGSEGGTPMHLAPIERRYLRLMHKPEWPLAVGELPYAPWDDRVRKAVMERDRLVKLGGSVDRLRATGSSEAMKAAAEAAEKEYRRTFWTVMSERLGETTELFAYCAKQEGADGVFRRQTREGSIVAKEARDHFIETGRIPEEFEYRTTRVSVPT